MGTSAAVFSVTNGLRRAVTAKTRQEFRRNTQALTLLDRSDEGRFRRERTSEITMQRRTSSSDSVRTGVKRHNAGSTPPGQSRDWGPKKTRQGSEIKVTLRDAIDSRYDLPRLDVVQSPLNEIEDTRAVISAELSQQFDDDIYTFFDSLESSTPVTGLVGEVPTPTYNANGGAGSISTVNVGARASNANGTDIFSPATLTLDKASGNASTIPDQFMLRIIDDMVLWAKEQNLVDGRVLQGSLPQTLYLVMPVALFQRALLTQLKGETGYALEALGEEMLRRNSAFTGVPFSARLGLQNITILAFNGYPKPTTADDQEWVMYAGYTGAVVGGIGDDFSRMWTPETNPDGEGYDLYQNVRPYFNLLNGDGIRKYTIPAAKTS